MSVLLSNNTAAKTDVSISMHVHCLDIVVELGFLLREGIEEGVGEG